MTKNKRTEVTYTQLDVLASKLNIVKNPLEKIYLALAFGYKNPENIAINIHRIHQMLEKDETIVSYSANHGIDPSTLISAVGKIVSKTAEPYPGDVASVLRLASTIHIAKRESELALFSAMMTENVNPWSFEEALDNTASIAIYPQQDNTAPEETVSIRL